MTWNYRVVVTGEDDGEEIAAICEVYYDADDKILAWSDPVKVETVTEEIEETLRYMRYALEKPVIRNIQVGMPRD